jgi:outer membrane lipoprotein SlyB
MNFNRPLSTAGAVALAAVLATSVGGCASSLSGGSYTRSQARTAQYVDMGTVESVRHVQIEGTKSGVGTVGGAALGGIAGSTLGSGRRANAAGAVGGAILGGLAGSAVEEGMTSQPGLEITVRLDSGRIIAVTQGADEGFYPGDRVRVITAPDGTARVSH